MVYKTRLPELKFSIDEATALSVLTEWIRETYEIAERDYSIEFVKSAIDGQYHVTAKFKDILEREARRPFSEVSGDDRVPFTIVTPGSK